MALGFGFNKQKVLGNAEKYVQQGKLQNAISEYEKVTKEDPKDLTVLNTIGDLYARVGQNDKAVSYFRKVGDAYAGEGFTVKAIAMYKKLTKLAPANTDCTLKLAELYTQQGLYNDARSQYVLVADAYMKAGDADSSAKIFQKLLELDPENAAMQSKLADLYVKMGRRDEARNIFLTAAQSLYGRGALDAADDALGKVIHLDPGNADALMLRGQIAVDAGDGATAIPYLEKIPKLDSRPDALRSLLRAYVQVGRMDDATPIAAKLISIHNDISGVTSIAEALLAKQDVEGALRVYDANSDKLLAVAPPGLMEALHATISSVKDNVGPLEILRRLYQKAADSSHLTEVSELLAHAYVAAGDLSKGKDLYQELAQLEPENPLHAQNYKQIVARLGEDSATRPLTAEEGAQAFMVDELEISTAAIDQEYPEAVSEAIKAAITDSELLDSYNLPAKAIAPLEAVLPQAPSDTRLNQRLASLYARAGRYQDAGRCCEMLAQAYAVAGHTSEAQQYTDMAAKYRAQGGPAEVPLAAPEMPVVTAAAVEMPVEAAPAAAEFSMEVAPPAAEMPVTPPPAVDEWESMLTTEAPAVAPPAAEPTSQFIGREAAAAAAASTSELADLIEEVKFYLSQSMLEEARTALDKCSTMDPSHPALPELREQLANLLVTADTQKIEVQPEAAPSVSALVFDEAALQAAAAAEPAPAPEAPPTPVEPAPEEMPVMMEVEPAVEAPPPPEPAPEPEPAPPVEAAPPPPPPAPAAAPAAAADVLGDFVLDLEESLGDDFAIAGKAAPPPKPAAAAPPPKPAAPPPPPPVPVAAPAMSAAAAAAPAAAAQAEITLEHPEATSALSDMFAEFKEDVEETAGQAEDPDTHYNLGVAFKEMGLMDEAIGELQKVCQAIEKGYPFGQVMQAYTWLAHCFVEKGVPQAAVKWYEKALKVPTADEETKLAIHYDLGSTHEAAGNKKAALDHFMEVYGSNIDYRDVAERIKALRS